MWELLKISETIYWNLSQHEYLEEGVPYETKKSYDSSTNELCLIAGYTKENTGQLFNIVMKLEYEDFSFGTVTMEQSQNSIMKEDEILLSHKDNQCLIFFLVIQG